jgi:prepilin-type N-terminal cleavage/methylation domain-containing protein
MKTNSCLHQTAHPKTPAAGSRRAFTLIELLVVISIIAMLAGISLPAMQNAILAAQQNHALQQARQIGLGLRMCAGDNEGIMPSGTNSYGEAIKTSNDAFRSLVPNYVDDERIFTISKSKLGPKSDGVIDPSGEILKPGENHFAYVEGLGTSSSSRWPLVVDGTGGSRKYSTNDADINGTWKGRRGIVINVDSSATLVTMCGTGTERYLPMYNDPQKNLLDVEGYMGSTVRLLEPAH